MGSFVIHTRNEGCYYVALLDVNGDLILRGNDCEDLSTCKCSIDLIRANANDFSKYELNESHKGKYYFEIKGSDGKNVAQSVLFENVENVYFGIEMARRTIPTAILDEYAFHYRF